MYQEHTVSIQKYWSLILFSVHDDNGIQQEEQTMKKPLLYTTTSILAVILLLAIKAYPIDMEWITIGDTGNDNDIHGDAYGGVSYEYRIGKCEVTNNQYIEFLNAVALSDPYGLYSMNMGGTYGGITRTDSSGSYSYSLKNGDTNWGTKPVNYVDWYDALRFANWMHNGATNSSETEDGAYDMSLGTNVVRKAGASIFLPSENEWYKAAFYDGSTATYYNYATGSDTAPNTNPPSSDTGNSANYFFSSYVVGSPYYMTDVGAYTLSSSPYGTYDQNGNLLEWMEDPIFGTDRVIRGGSFDTNWALKADTRGDFWPGSESFQVGFRLASAALVPEPTAMCLFGLGLVYGFIRKRLRK